MNLIIILTLIFIFYLFIVIRVYELSLKNHKLYSKLAQNNIHKKIYIKPSRGIIYDSNHIPVAYNELRFSILIKPQLKAKQLSETIHFIHTILPNSKTEKLLKNYKKQNSN